MLERANRTPDAEFLLFAVPVGFSMGHVGIIVTPLQSLALRESEQMMAELEVNDGSLDS